MSDQMKSSKSGIKNRSKITRLELKLVAEKLPRLWPVKKAAFFFSQCHHTSLIAVEPPELPALSEGAVLVWKITSVLGLGWFLPQWDTEILLKVRKQVHHSPSNRLKVGQRSLKACSVLVFYQWPFKEKQTQFKGLCCSLKNLTSVPEPLSAAVLMLH